MKRFIFPILGFDILDVSCKNIISSGTGFLINNDGHFFSAGHNFYKSKKRGEVEQVELSCFALIKNQLIQIEKLYLEYDNDSTLSKKDFFVGKFKAPFCEQEDNIKMESDEFFMTGYSIRDLPYETIESIQFNNITFKLYKVPIISTSNILNYGGINFSYENVLYYNCEVIVDFYGLSGCPIFKSNKLYGLLISTFFITIDYLKKIADSELKIELD